MSAIKSKFWLLRPNILGQLPLRPSALQARPNVFQANFVVQATSFRPGHPMPWTPLPWTLPPCPRPSFDPPSPDRLRGQPGVHKMSRELQMCLFAPFLECKTPKPQTQVHEKPKKYRKKRVGKGNKNAPKFSPHPGPPPSGPPPNRPHLFLGPPPPRRPQPGPLHFSRTAPPRTALIQTDPTLTPSLPPTPPPHRDGGKFDFWGFLNKKRFFIINLKKLAIKFSKLHFNFFVIKKFTNDI